MKIHLLLALLLGFGLSTASGSLTFAREWKDQSGTVTVKGTLIAADAKEIVVKLDESVEGRELLAIPIETLSDDDQKFLQSEENESALKTASEKHTWSLRNGMKVFGRVVDFARKDVTLQRRRGKLYVNDRPFENLPEIYQRMIPKIVEVFENRTFANDSQFNDWVLAQRGNARTFTCEGVMIEFPNGDEYGIPFFFFEQWDLNLLRSYWEQWLAAHQSSSSTASEEERQHSLFLQSQAATAQEYQLAHQREMAQIARMQLKLSAVAAGVTSMWEVYLFPPFDVPFLSPLSVVVTARNSDDAARIALMNNPPGYRVGPIRRFSGF
ncbi:MAG: hypothetical protein WCI02_10965 [Planctomycetota bacterium]